MRTPAQAAAYAKTVTRDSVGHCLMFVQSCYPVPPTQPSAIAAWNTAQHRHGVLSTPPVGVPVYFASTAGNRYGHIAISLGGWMCRSTDYPSAGRVSNVDIRTLARQWAHPYLGWSEDLGGVRVYTPPVLKPVVPTLPYTIGLGATGAFVKVVQLALGHEQTGTLNAGDVLAIRTFQSRHPFATFPDKRGYVGQRTYRALCTSARVKAVYR